MDAGAWDSAGAGDIENIMSITVDFCKNASYNTATKIYELLVIWRR